MAYVQADLDNLQAALVGGVLSVEYAGRRTTFRSMDDLQRAIDVVSRALSPATAVPARTVGTYASGLQAARLDPGRGPFRR